MQLRDETLGRIRKALGQSHKTTTKNKAKSRKFISQAEKHIP